MATKPASVVPQAAPPNPAIIDGLIVQLEMLSRGLGNGAPAKVAKKFTEFLDSLKEWSGELKEKAVNVNASKSA